MVRAGSFRPSVSEVSFGEVKDARETIGKYELAFSDGRILSLDGKIDRLDDAELDGEKIAIVFDYKRRDRTFNWSKLYYGLDMQLPIYMLAVRNASRGQRTEDRGQRTEDRGQKTEDALCSILDAQVAGAFYMPVEVTPTGATLDELSEKTEGFDYKAKGIFNGEFSRELDKAALKDSKFYNFYVTKDGEPYGSYGNRGVLKPADFEKVLKFTERKIVRLAEEILSGRIEVKPYRLSGKSPCSYCKYKPLCRFDWQINDYNPLESLGKIRVLEEMGGG
ncbi:ATP-dependent helicase/deoxyribonuclease subunit B [subsurface metagenome]